MVYMIIVIIFAADQWAKNIIQKSFIPGQTYPVLKDIFHLTYVQNRGAAFGVLSGYTDLFIIISFIVISGLFIYYFRSRPNILLSLATGLIIAGAAGNFYDRIKLGYVVDYLDFRIWPVFNLADSSVVIGTGILIIYLWKSGELT